MKALQNCLPHRKYVIFKLTSIESAFEHLSLSCSCSRNDDSQRLRKSFRNFILSQVNINRYVNHMSRSIRMNGHRNKQHLYIRQRYVPEYSQSTTKVGYSSSKFQQDLALIQNVHSQSRMFNIDLEQSITFSMCLE